MQEPKGPGFLRRFASAVKHYATLTFQRYQNLHLYGKLVVASVILLYIAILVAFIVITPAHIAQTFYDFGQKFSHQRYGWVLLGALMIFISFPPMIGHTTLLNVCGFAYGMKGFPLAAGASVLGSAIVFVVLRLLFSKRLRIWSSTNEKWQALEAVVNSKGLPLIILIRLSSFPPWVYSNMLFASIEAVALWQFIIATCCVFPKFLLYVFIGSRLAALSDGKQRQAMDTTTKIVNTCVIVGGILISAIASWVVYSSLRKQLREASPNRDELAEEAIEEADEGAPLLDHFDVESGESR